MLEYGSYYYQEDSNILWLQRAGAREWEQVCAVPQGTLVLYINTRFFSRVDWVHPSERTQTCEKNNKNNELPEASGPSEIYIQQLTQGWCLPWGTTGGDLCAPPISADLPETCGHVDEKFYDLDDELVAKAKCSADSACKGYTKNIDTGRIKLKGSVAISGVRPDNNYQCHQKILLV